jgi:hypothetical protein
MLDEDLLRDYCNEFFGYGNLKGKYWFIGPEEGGGRCEEVIRNRLRLWDRDFRRAPIIDCREFHCSLIGCEGRSLCDLFQDPPRRQPTWDRLIRVQLAAEGRPNITPDDVANVRVSGWGQTASDNCLLELLPLPCPSTGAREWLHHQWTKNDSVFQTRDTYEAEFFARREAGLKALIGEHKPQVLVFYGSGERWIPHWSAIAGFDWLKVKPTIHGESAYRGIFQCHDKTLYVLMHHPGECRRNAYFAWVGEEIKNRLPHCTDR